MPPTSSPTAASRLRTGAVALAAAMALTAAPALAEDNNGGAAPAPAPAPAAAPAAQPTLSLGSKGVAVRRLQRKLRLQADGHFGRRTRSALKRWQRRHGFKADGVAGPAVLDALGVKARAARTAPALSGDVAAILQRIAQCESGGNPKAVSANGRYRGKYQFSRSTWANMGGAGDPAEAPEAEQDRIAAKLYAAQGTKPWPVCGKS